MGAELPQPKKSCVYVCGVTLVMSNSLQPCRLWPARLLCQGILQARILVRLVNTGCHTLLEHYIFCFLSHQLPWVPGTARTPVTQAAVPPPHLALTGANPTPPGQPQEQIPVDNPLAEVEIKTQLKPRSSVAKKRFKTFPPAVQAAD